MPAFPSKAMGPYPKCPPSSSAICTKTCWDGLELPHLGLPSQPCLSPSWVLSHGSKAKRSRRTKLVSLWKWIYAIYPLSSPLARLSTGPHFSVEGFLNQIICICTFLGTWKLRIREVLRINPLLLLWFWWLCQDGFVQSKASTVFSATLLWLLV